MAETSKQIWESLMNELLDEVSLGLCFEMHRSCKRGTFFLDEMDDVSQSRYEIVNVRGLDVFGQVPSTKKQYDCVCPNCQRSLAASRFAPHLEKCMGMGGNIVRVPRRSRVLNVNKQTTDVESEDNSNDNDWTYGANSKKAKKLKKNLSVKKKGLKKLGSFSPVANSSTWNSPPSSSALSSIYDTMSPEEKKSLLHRICGVMTGHTKKMCTRSIKCPQHTDEQRQQVRNSLMQRHIGLDESYDSESQVTDVDESKVLKTPTRSQLMWDSMIAQKSSPADSVSTATSSSSRKRKNIWAKKAKKKKKKKRLSSFTLPDIRSDSTSSSFVS